MTHLYTILRGGIILVGGTPGEATASGDATTVGGTAAAGATAGDATRASATAIAWAEDVVLAIGSDAEVSAISRGDSRFVELGGASVIPLESSGVPRWPTTAVLDVGGPADLAVLAGDPRDPPGIRGMSLSSPIAIVRAGRVVAGRLPGAPATRDPSGP